MTLSPDNNSIFVNRNKFESIKMPGKNKKIVLGKEFIPRNYKLKSALSPQAQNTSQLSTEIPEP